MYRKTKHKRKTLLYALFTKLYCRRNIKEIQRKMHNH